jgi:hypothetical protein
VFEVQTDRLVRTIQRRIAATVDVEGLVGVGTLVLEDGQRLADGQWPGPGAGLTANTDRRERKARGGPGLPTRP